MPRNACWTKQRSNMRRSDLAFTEDGILGNRVRLRQPLEGDRAAIDPVLLAAAVPAKAGETILDAGTGSGVAALCLASRLPDVSIEALEIQPDLALLARESAAINGFEARLTVREGDLMTAREAAFDHVMTNPPFLGPGEGTASPDSRRRRAHIHDETDLKGWVRACLALLRAGGTLTLIHRADRIDGILAALEGLAGGVAVFPLWPAAAKPARRVIVRARRGVRAQAQIHPGLVLHDPAGGYSEAAERILRHAEALVF